MKISRRRLLDEAQTTGFRPEVLEKVIQLLNLLQGFNHHPFLKGKLTPDFPSKSVQKGKTLIV